MPLKGLLASRSGVADAADGVAGAVSPVSGLSDRQKLAMLEDLERSGLGWFWASDAKGNLAYISTAVAERLALSEGDLLGRCVSSIFEPAESMGSAVHGRHSGPTAGEEKN